MLLEQLKLELLNTIGKFETDVKELTKEMSILLGELTALIEQANSAMQLMSYIEKRLMKVPYKFLGFLPSIPDIRRRIEKVLHNPMYELKHILADENNDIRYENASLKKEIAGLKESIQNQNPEHTEELKTLVRQVQMLEQKFAEQCDRNTQLLRENHYLHQQMDILQTQNQRLTSELITAKAKEERLDHHYGTILDENTQLRLELDTLKKQLALPKNTSASNDNKPTGFLRFYKS